MIKKFLFFTLIAFAASGALAVDNKHEELGTINWLRDYDTALNLAAKTDKPVLILFQEVPGCATCRNYGLQVLSHPLLAEAAEEFFVPLVIFNNRTGADAEVLRLYKEPSWNNPVVRIIDSNENELTRRLSGDYSPGGFAASMINALKATGVRPPEYLQIVYSELSARGYTETARLSMFCFWEGEIKLGAIPGVITTRAGFIEGKEVVELEYDSRVLSYKKLLRKAAKVRCADMAFPLNAAQERTAEKVLGRERVGSLSRFRADRGTKYYLSKTPYRFLPMTELQKILANIAVYRGQDPHGVLSPRQRETVEEIRMHPQKKWQNVISSDDFQNDWQSLEGNIALGD